jgi:N-dimethylarginine dimethylaminohydrolase
LINTFNGQFVAIKNKTIIDHDENVDRLKEKLKQKGVETATILVEFIRDKRNQIDQ